MSPSKCCPDALPILKPPGLSLGLSEVLPTTKSFWTRQNTLCAERGTALLPLAAFSTMLKSQFLSVRSQLHSWLRVPLEAALQALARVIVISRRILGRIHLLPSSFTWLLAGLGFSLAVVLDISSLPRGILFGEVHSLSSGFPQSIEGE